MDNHQCKCKSKSTGARCMNQALSGGVYCGIHTRHACKLNWMADAPTAFKKAPQPTIFVPNVPFVPFVPNVPFVPFVPNVPFVPIVPAKLQNPPVKMDNRQCKCMSKSTGARCTKKASSGGVYCGIHTRHACKFNWMAAQPTNMIKPIFVSAVIPMQKQKPVMPNKKQTEPKGCTKQFDKKYTSRPSPAYPANACCGEIMEGNNGKLYTSKPDKNGRCSWKLNK